MSRLKKYANAYNLNTRGALEKDEFIDALVSARQENGCLPPNHEVRQCSFYPQGSLNRLHILVIELRASSQEGTIATLIHAPSSRLVKISDIGINPV